MKTLDELLYPCEVIIDLARRNYDGEVSVFDRHGIMAHYDASKTDQGALNWFDSPEFKLSYNRGYTDNGRRVRLTPSMMFAAYHAGVCKTTNVIKSANRAFFGLCVTAGDKQPKNAETGAVVTPAQFDAIVYDAAIIARFMQLQSSALAQRFHVDNIDFWLTGHNEWAIYPARYTEGVNKGKPHPLAGQFGRKQDPRGTHPDYDVLPINSLRASVAVLLDSPSHVIWQRFN